MGNHDRIRYPKGKRSDYVMLTKMMKERIKMRKITLIPGDGIGPEVVDSVVKVIDAAEVKIEWEKVEAGAQALKKYGTVLPGIN